MTKLPLFATMSELDMANVAQLVRALVCGSGGRGFKPHRSPHIKNFRHSCLKFFIWGMAERHKNRSLIGRANLGY